MTPDEEPGQQPEGPDGANLASVVLIDRREDIAAICGRVDMAPTYAVVIHAPDGNRQLSTELGMRRLQRHAEESGKLVAIATGAVNLAGRARLAGIPVARRPQEVRWDAGGRRVIRFFGRSIALPSLGRYAQFALVALALVGLGLLALTMAPATTVTAYPHLESLTQVVTVTGSRTQQGIDSAALAVPIQDVSGTQTVTLTVPTTGKVAVGILPAKAAITITNPTAAAIALPAGSVVLGGPAFLPYVTDAALTVPPGGTATATVTAEQRGIAGNLAAGALTGWLDAKLRTMTVTNPAAAVGGTTEERPGVAPADLAAVTALAEAFGKSDAARQALIALRPGDAIFLHTAKTTISLGSPSAEVGSAADFLLLPVTAKVEAAAIVATNLQQLARLVLQPTGSHGEILADSVSGVETGTAATDATSGDVRTELRLRASFARNVTAEDIKEAVKGISEDGAKSTLKSRYGIQDVDVETTPSWAPRLPRFDFRITARLAARTPAAEPSPRKSNDNTPAAGSTPAASARP
ncbi:MAG: baseplate J/gp47 family protein [Tepidiformaceae bacterium]